MELVVARYDESIAWLEHVPAEWTIRVMDMGGWNGELPQRKIETVRIPNLGHESYAYLSHVVFRFEQLDEFTVFCQGNPSDHSAECDPPDLPSFTARMGQIRNVILNAYIKKIEPPDWLPIGRIRNSEDGQVPALCRRFKRSSLVNYRLRDIGPPLGEIATHPLEDVWHYIFPGQPFPYELPYIWGNQFMARKRLFTSRPLEFWRRMIRILEHDPLPFEASALERLWPSILRS